MYYGSLHVNLSQEHDHKRVYTIPQLCDDLFRDLISKESFFTCLPNFVLSQSIKRLSGPSSTSLSEKLLSQIVSFLQDVNYKAKFMSVLSLISQSENLIHDSIYIESLSCFITILLTFNSLVDYARGCSSEDTTRVLLSLCNRRSLFGNPAFVKRTTEKLIASLSSFSDHGIHVEEANVYFTTLIVEVLSKMCSFTEVLTESRPLKCAKWTLLRTICELVHASKLRHFASTLKWLLHSPFVDSDESFRFYCCDEIGPLLLSNDFKVLRILYSNDDGGGDSDGCDLVQKLFSDVDELFATHCGVMQSSHSLTLRSTHSSCTNNSTWNGDAEETSANCSRQVSSALAISSICKNADDDTAAGKLIIEKCVMRLVRLWTVLSDTADLSPNTCHAQVALVAFKELINLNHMGIFGPKMIEHNQDSFLTSLFAEILSRGIIEQNVHGNNVTSGSKDFKMLVTMIQAFFIKKNKPIDSQYDEDNVVAIVSFVDKVLPSVITGLILMKDYETLCSCTGFRLHLLSELQRLKRNALVQSKEKVVGVSCRKKASQTIRAIHFKDLKQNTSLLCRSDDGVKVLTKLLPALLMTPDKSPLLFYLRTVLQCQVTLGELIKINERKIIVEIVWALGGEENEVDDDFIVAPKTWLDVKSSSPTVQGLKKGAIIMKQVNDEKLNLHVQENETLQSLEVLASLNLNDSGTESSTEAEDWIHRNFMMLFVKCVTFKWKIGGHKTKIQAVKCLRVLIRFLRASDCTQYITQILTMIDSVMNFSCSDASCSKSLLQLLAMRALTHFVHVLLMHRLDAVGENLCKIIVSVFPLFDSSSEIGDNDSSCDPYIDVAISQAVGMMEALSDGENGRKLASYFNDIPFLPKHPRLQHVRETLKRIGVNVDHPLFFSTALSNLNISKVRVDTTSATPSSTDDNVSSGDGMIVALRRRLHCFKRLFNHENDNVRKLVLEHLTTLIRGNRELFHNLVKTEDASLQFLTVQSSLPFEEPQSGIQYNGKMNTFYFNNFNDINEKNNFLVNC